MGICCYISVWAWVRSAGSCVASGILLQLRRAPLHMFEILVYSAFFVAWLVYRVLLGFSFPPFPPGSVGLLLFGIGVSVKGLVRVSSLSYILIIFPLSFYSQCDGC